MPESAHPLSAVRDLLRHLQAQASAALPTNKSSSMSHPVPPTSAKPAPANNAQVLDAVRDPGGDELYFDPTTGELVVGSGGAEQAPTDAVTATKMAREGFFAATDGGGTPDVRQAIVHADALAAAPGARVPACILDGDVLIVGRGPVAPRGSVVAAHVRRSGGDATPPFAHRLCIDETGDSPSVQVQAPDGAGGWRAVPTEGPLDLSGFGARNRGVLETDVLSDRTVAVVGLGSGGSSIASELAKAGVGRFVLIDRDRLDVANVGRHVCDASDLGRRKTAAMADRLRARNPAVRIDTIDADILADPEQTRRWLEGVDAIVAATDNNPSRLLLNRIAVETGTPVVFGRAFVRACGGDVIRVRPSDPACPCYACLIRDRVEEEELTSARSSAAPAYADREVRAEPGLSLDIAPIAHFCARLVLQELLRGTDSGLRSLEADLPGALFLWANRREGRFARWPIMGAGVRQLSVQRWYGVRAQRDPTCETCNPDAFLANLEASIDADMARLTG
jgi:molybdopterin/thiamine biosynthesis adenylyltransferase